MEAAYSIPAQTLTERLEHVIMEQGKPEKIRVDNGPEFTSKNFMNWCEANDIAIQYIQPGKPTQNAYIERLNRTFRESILDAYLFSDIEQVNILAENFMKDYNNERPHKSLGDLTPIEYERKFFLQEEDLLPEGTSIKLN